MNANGPGPEGVLILDKPQGITSHDAVYKIRRLYAERKVGHAGTLDPIATGVLVMLVGRAAKAAEYIAADRKRYEAVMTLGLTTDTLDADGKTLSVSDAIPSEAEVLAAARALTGSYGQIPPMYSAIKRDGVKMVDLARRGVAVDLPPRDITVFSLEARRLTDREYSLAVECSAGTYIRSLCRDIGQRLGCGAVMSALRRTASGCFDIANAVTLERLEEMTGDRRLSLLRPTESLFYGLDKLVLPDFFASLAANGQPVYLHKIGAAVPAGTRVRLYDADGFFALGSSDGETVKAVKQFRIKN